MTSASELLVACARVCLGRDPPDVLLPRVRPDTDWTAVVELALAEGVSPLLARAFRALSPGTLPEELALALVLHDDDNRSRTEDLIAALGIVVDGLAARGVEALPFKGPVLGALAYGDATLRRAGDLDLLVRRETLDVVYQYFRDEGFHEATDIALGRQATSAEDSAYRRFQCEYQFIRRADGLVVEPHWALAPPALAIDLAYPALWSRARPARLWGRSFRMLETEDLFLAVCIHAAKHAWGRLQWICDIAALLGGEAALDLVTVLDRARSSGVERIVLVSVALVDIVLGMGSPEAVHHRLAADHTACSLADEVAHRLRRETGPTVSRLAFHRWYPRTRERRRDRWRYAYRRLTTPALHHLHLVPRPDRFFPLLVSLEWAHRYAMRPAQAAYRACSAPIRRHWHRWRPRRQVTRVLVVAPVPRCRDGGGARALLALLRVLAEAGYRLTLFPPRERQEIDDDLRRGLPQSLEIVAPAPLASLEAFLEDRGYTFEAILATAPEVLARVASLVRRRPTLQIRTLFFDTGASKAAAAGQGNTDALVLAARTADAVLTTSARVGARLRAATPGTVVQVPLPVLPAPAPEGFRQRHHLLFVGQFSEDGSSSVDALLWFLESIWPALRDRLARPDHAVLLDVAGPLGALGVALRADSGVRLLGPVDDLASAARHARVLVAPFRRAPLPTAEILEVAACGVPIVGTPVVSEDLAWIPGREVLTSPASDAAAFAAQVVATYSQPALWARLRTAALARLARCHRPEHARAAVHAALRAGAVEARRPQGHRSAGTQGGLC